MTPSTRRGLVSVTVIGPSGASASCPTPAGRGGKIVWSAITPGRFGTTTPGFGRCATIRGPPRGFRPLIRYQTAAPPTIVTPTPNTIPITIRSTSDEEEEELDDRLR